MHRNAGRVSVFVFCLFTSPQAWPQIEVGNYPDAKSSDWFKTYILGVVNGISRGSLRPDRASPYCPPGVPRLDADDYIAILDRQILNETRKPGGLRDDTPIELLLLQGLAQKFPCKK